MAGGECRRKYRIEVRQQLGLVMNTERDGRTLALGRELAAYVIAADLIRLPVYDAAFDTHEFRPWLRRALTETLAGRTLQSTHADRPNNWGTHAGASRAAVAAYLEDGAGCSAPPGCSRVFWHPVASASACQARQEHGLDRLDAR